MMKFIFMVFLSFSVMASDCYERCQNVSGRERIQCLKACYPEIHSFCEKRFHSMEKDSEGSLMAMGQCLKYAYPCQDRCASKDKNKEKSCRDECLGN